MISLRHIEIFHAVYQFGSVSGAARALGVSQPSVSKLLRHMESRIGFPLFRVVKGRLAPTEEAHALFGEARDVQMRVESFSALLDNLGRVGNAHLRVAALHSLGLDVVPRAVAAFRVRHPRISFEIRTVHSEAIASALYERAADLAIAFDVPQQPGLVETKLGTGGLGVLFHRADFPMPPDRFTAELLASRTIIRLLNSGSVGALLDSCYALLGGRSPAEITAHTYFVAAALVRERAGVAIVDSFTARASLTPELDFRLLEAAANFEVYALTLDTAPPSKTCRDFLASLRHAIAGWQS